MQLIYVMCISVAHVHLNSEASGEECIMCQYVLHELQNYLSKDPTRVLSFSLLQATDMYRFLISFCGSIMEGPEMS